MPDGSSFRETSAEPLIENPDAAAASRRLESLVQGTVAAIDGTTISIECRFVLRSRRRRERTRRHVTETRAALETWRIHNRAIRLNERSAADLTARRQRTHRSRSAKESASSSAKRSWREAQVIEESEFSVSGRCARVCVAHRALRSAAGSAMPTSGRACALWHLQDCPPQWATPHRARIVIQVRYDGEDLDDVAARVGMTIDDVIANSHGD